ncbi:MAG: DUF3540 domain-containing protein [Phreatobacter sp.]|uniref:DUF3540 domain-containing protein n=1 Tax=Phreatobacter sp. TaxID=1966341 RepID=UPI00273566A8|nr:DUF3540 domain-containing protein [Phreatobacter sp.]MDP2801269.1 DUF3540 domain-containing protein [Phreatobacter sp.]
MRVAVSPQETGSLILREADVIEVAGPRALVRIDDRVLPASRALSCLIEIAAGDQVLVAATKTEAIVIAVTRRPGLGDATLSLPDSAARMTLRAQALALGAATTVTVEAPDVSIDAARLSLLGQVTHWFGRTLTLIGDKLTTSVATSETIAKKTLLRSNSRVTVIDGLDTEQVGSRVSDVSGLSASSAGSAIITGSEDVRIDAKRITMG